MSRVAVERVQDVDVLAQLAGLGVPEPHPVADPQPGRARPAQRRLHLAGALRRAASAGPAGRSGTGQPVGARAGRRRSSRRRHGDDAGRRHAGSPGAAKNAAGAGGEGPVAVEQRGAVQARPGGDLGDRRLGARCARRCRCRRR